MIPDGLPADTSDLIRPLTDTLSLNVVPQMLSLRDAIQISLHKSDIVRTLGSNGVQIEEVTRYDPAITRLRSDVATTVFDPRITTGYVGSRIDEPSGTFFGPGIPQNVRRDEGDFTAAVSKSWATGATTSVGYLPPLGYLFYPPGTTGQFNPTYTSDLVFQLQQPLLRGAGWTVNLAPIRIAQLKAEQTAWECKQATMAQVRSVEAAYWELQAALMSVDAVENILPLMSEIVRIEKLRMEQELSTHADVARASIQFDTLQQLRIRLRNDAVASELRLRNLLAMDLAEPMRLVPADLPRQILAPLDHAAAMSNALESRPDLIRQRLGVRVRELEFAVARNGVRPQLDLQALYRTNGIGQHLDDSLQQMIGFEYTDWTLGATFSIPLGNRAAKFRLQVAELELTRDRAVLNQSIQNLSFELADQIRESDAAFAQYELAVQRMRNCQEWIRAAKIRYSTPPPSEDGNQNWLLLSLYDYQNALRMHVDATTEAAQLLARYNVQLARLEEAQGILLENRGIEMADDPCVAVQQVSSRLFGTAHHHYPTTKAGSNGLQMRDGEQTHLGHAGENRPGWQPVASSPFNRLAADNRFPATAQPSSRDSNAKFRQSQLPPPGHTAGSNGNPGPWTIRPTNYRAIEDVRVAPGSHWPDVRR